MPRRCGLCPGSGDVCVERVVAVPSGVDAVAPWFKRQQLMPVCGGVQTRSTAESFLALPEYPGTKPLAIGDRAAIESCTHRLPCSSDHNFTSLWMWDIDRQTRVGRIGTNLVIELLDYETREHRLTLIGDDDVPTACEQALSFGTSRLDLVPDFVASQLPPSRFLVEHDRDQDDYVLSTRELSAIGGKRGKQADQCRRSLGARLRVRTEIPDPQTALLGLFDRWVATRGKDHESTRAERHAVQRLVDGWECLNLATVALYDGQALIAADVYEVLPDCGISHFQKADAAHAGIFPLICQSLGGQLAVSGVDQLNAEQDLGIEGLRNSKLSYKPVRFVRKYQVRLHR